MELPGPRALPMLFSDSPPVTLICLPSVVDRSDSNAYAVLSTPQMLWLWETGEGGHLDAPRTNESVVTPRPSRAKETVPRQRAEHCWGWASWSWKSFLVLIWVRLHSWGSVFSSVDWQWCLLVMEMCGRAAFVGVQNRAQPGGAPAMPRGNRRSDSLTSIPGAPFRIHQRLSPRVTPGEWFDTCRGRRESTARTAGELGGDLAALDQHAGSSSRGISFYGKQKHLMNPRLEALAFYLPGSMQRPPRSLWASPVPSMVFKPQHKGSGQPYWTLHRLRAVAPRRGLVLRVCGPLLTLGCLRGFFAFFSALGPFITAPECHSASRPPLLPAQVHREGATLQP